MIRSTKPLIVLGLLVVTGSGVASGQEPSSASRVAKLDTPFALQMEHKHVREELGRARTEAGAVGDAVRDLEQVLLPHLDREEALALRPLGLMRGIARDATPVDLTQAIPMAVQIERELPTLLDEHRRIGEATRRLADVARREGKPQYQALADRLWLHARLEEEVLYPAAILVGEYARITAATKPGTARRARP